MRIGEGITGGTGGVEVIRSKGEATHVNPHIKTDNPEAKDVFSVSSTAQLVASARGKINEMPVIRAGSVESVQNQLNSGAYRPDTAAVVDGLLREYMQRSSY